MHRREAFNLFYTHTHIFCIYISCFHNINMICNNIHMREIRLHQWHDTFLTKTFTKVKKLKHKCIFNIWSNFKLFCPQKYCSANSTRSRDLFSHVCLTYSFSYFVGIFFYTQLLLLLLLLESILSKKYKYICMENSLIRMYKQTSQTHTHKFTIFYTQK